MDAVIDSELICSRLFKASQFYTPDPQTYCLNKYFSNKKTTKMKPITFEMVLQMVPG